MRTVLMTAAALGCLAAVSIQVEAAGTGDSSSTLVPGGWLQAPAVAPPEPPPARETVSRPPATPSPAPPAPPPRRRVEHRAAPHPRPSVESAPAGDGKVRF
jgi:hypothetical protein